MMDVIDLASLAPFALVSLDERRRVVAANPEAQSILGHSQRAMYRKPLSEVLFHDSPIFELIDRSLELAGDVTAHGVAIRGPSLKNKRTMDIKLRPSGDGGIVIAMIQTDDNQIIESNPAGVAAFGRILGHEVKNPLAGISGAAQLLSRRARDDQSAMLDIIQSETKRIERLVSRLSAFELFSSPAKELINIHELLDRVVASEEAAHGAQVIVKRLYDPSLPELEADQDHLHEAIQNVMRNAIEAATAYSSKPEVSVQTAFETGFAIAGSGSKRLSRAIRVTVQDNGGGISPEQRSKIFDMFNSTKSGGRGLGLSIVNEIVTAHRGRIKVDSSDGLTRFSIYLPLPKTGYS